jgi:hypothetical protein
MFGKELNSWPFQCQQITHCALANKAHVSRPILSDGVDACDLRYWNCIPTLCIDRLRTSLRALWRVLPPVLNIM